MERAREERIQDILNYIRFDKYGIQKEIEKNIDLFEEDNYEHPFEEKENWNEDYISKNLVWLRKNFSRKRLEHLIEVRNYVRGEIKSKTIERGENTKRENTRNDKKALNSVEKNSLKKYRNYSPREKKETKSLWEFIKKKILRNGGKND